MAVVTGDEEALGGTQEKEILAVPEFKFIDQGPAVQRSSASEQL